MNRWLVPAWALLACVCSLPALAEMPRAIGFRYDVEVGPLTGKEPVRVFVPLAQTDEHQRVLSRELTASIPGVEAREDQHGNAFWQGELAPRADRNAPDAHRGVLPSGSSGRASARPGAPDRERRSLHARLLAQPRALPR